jgi:hypothetical protein
MGFDKTLAEGHTKLLDEQMRWASNRLADLEARNGSSTTVQTDDSGYGTIHVDQGIFIVRAVSATPYLDGYKVHLKIGNSTSATFRGATTNIMWGTSQDSTDKDYDVTNLFPSGAYTDVDVFFEPRQSRGSQNHSGRT